MIPPREDMELEERSAWPFQVHAILWVLSAALLGLFFYRLAEGTTSIWLMGVFPIPLLGSLAVLRSARTIALTAGGMLINDRLIHRWSEIESYAIHTEEGVSWLCIRLTTSSAMASGLSARWQHGGMEYHYRFRVSPEDVSGVSTVEYAAAGSSPSHKPGRDASVNVRLETREPATISVQAGSLSDLPESAPRIAREAPDEMRFNPAHSGKLMLLLGPLTLSGEDEAGAMLETLKEQMAAEFPGEVHVEAVWAERA